MVHTQDMSCQIEAGTNLKSFLEIKVGESVNIGGFISVCHLRSYVLDINKALINAAKKDFENNYLLKRYEQVINESNLSYNIRRIS